MGVGGPRRDRSDAGWGVLLMGSAAAGVWVSTHWPWLAVMTTQQAFRPLHLGELLANDPVPYELFLLLAPLVAWRLLFLAGAVLLVLGLAPRRFLLRRIRFVPWLFVAPAGFVLLLTGVRWWGLYLARLWDAGPPSLHLGWVPHLHLLGGAALVGLAVWQGVKRWGSPLHAPRPLRTSLALVGLFAGTLLALPLLPYATTEIGEATFHHDEATLATFGAGAGGLVTSVAQDLAWFRLATTAGIVLAMASLAATVWGSSGQAPAWVRRGVIHAPLLSLPAVAVQGGLAMQLPLDLLRLAPGTTVGPNLVPQGAFLAALGLLALHLLRTPPSAGR